MMDMTLTGLRQQYLQQTLDPYSLIYDLRKKALQLSEYHIWISLLSEEQLDGYLQKLQQKSIESSPLWGIPFSIKDNIDLMGIPTTAGCPDFTYIPQRSATVVRYIIEAGGIPLGKTNLDQFATGLNGTRSPYGACHNAYHFDYISGGSSSGSAVSVAKKLVSFSLGTDTAGSGRVPAAFNQLLGFKPTIGLLSRQGLVPACHSLDCISIFTHNCDDANAILAVVEGYDCQDAYSRHNPFYNQVHAYGTSTGILHIGILPNRQLKFFGDHHYEKAYQETIKALSADHIEWIEIEYDDFDETARLLYEGPWLAERYLAALPLIKNNPQTIEPTVRKIIEQGESLKATEVFAAQYRLQALKQRCLEKLQAIDCLLLPTAGKLFTINEIQEEPILYNSQLGYYTNFLNLLDLSAVALPTIMTDQGLPFGVTLVGDAFADRYLLSIARRMEKIFQRGRHDDLVCISDSRFISVAVCGAHLTGFPLNWQLTCRGAVLSDITTTAQSYRMYLIKGKIDRPGLIYDEKNGVAIEIEIWQVPRESFGSFVDGITQPLAIGKIKTKNGQWINGFVAEAYVADSNLEISQYGSWRKFKAQEA